MTDRIVAPRAQSFGLAETVSSGPQTLMAQQADFAALTLRLGLGSVFIVGGWWKLQRAIDAARADGLVSKYTASDGYINAFFQKYLFTDGVLSAWSFLTALSAFELLAGIALITGFLVRPLAILFGVMMWSFVAALPVVTAPGVVPGAKAVLSPAMIVQIRDIGLSGMCFALAALGSGTFSLDARLFGRGGAPQQANWAALGLLLRLSVAVAFLAGGFFFGLDHVKSWSGSALLLVVIGLVLAAGHGVRIAAFAAFIVLAFYCIGKIAPAQTLWDNLNALKREFAFLAACIVLIRFSGGSAFQLWSPIRAPAEVFWGAERKPLK